MDQYHGTDKASALLIMKDGIDVTQGGGELGRGFYTGNYEWEAFNWNWHKHSDKGSVIKFDISEEPFYEHDVRILTVTEGMAFYSAIKKGGHTRTHLYHCDVVWASFFGYEPKSANAEQMKFESKDAENFMNGSDVNKVLI